MEKWKAPLAAAVGFWCWIGAMLASLLLALLAALVVLPKGVVVALAAAIFVAMLAVVAINPGAFAKRRSAETGG